MTDHYREEREALIEEAAKAIWEESTDPGRKGYWEDEPEYVADEYANQARAALAVFEQAHAPTGDEEPEWEYECRIPPFGWETCTDDPRFCPRGSERRRRRKTGPWEAFNG